MLPKSHPLHRIANHKTSGKIKHHKSPMNSLLAAYRFDPKRVEKIPATARDPTLQGELPFITSIANSREDSIKEAKSTSKEVQVFTDGSALDGKVGVAAILTREGKPPCVLHLTLGPKSKHTVHKVELVGILLRMHLISAESHRNTTFTLGVDNQVAISTFHSTLRNPGHHLARETLQIANRMQKCRQKGRYKPTICFFFFFFWNSVFIVNSCMLQDIIATSMGESSTTVLFLNPGD